MSKNTFQVREDLLFYPKHTDILNTLDEFIKYGGSSGSFVAKLTVKTQYQCQDSGCAFTRSIQRAESEWLYVVMPLHH